MASGTFTIPGSPILSLPFAVLFYLLFSDPGSFAILALTAGLTFFLVRNQTIPRLMTFILIALPWLLLKLGVFGNAGMPMGLSYMTLAFLSWGQNQKWVASSDRTSALPFFSSALFFPKLAAGPIVSLDDVGWH